MFKKKKKKKKKKKPTVHVNRMEFKLLPHCDFQIYFALIEQNDCTPVK